MKAITKSKMQEIDLYTQKNITPSIKLMEEAGMKIAEEVIKDYKFKRVLVLCGAKGNGGDGFVCARYLKNKGFDVECFLISNNLSEECMINIDLFNGIIYDTLPTLNYDLIIDALIGIGLNKDLKDNYIEIINKVNESNINIVSIDIPSGIDSNSGISYKAFIKADTNYSVKYHKVGLFLNDGLDSYNKLKLIDINIINTIDLININELSDFYNILPKRLRNTNKSSYKRASIIAGSKMYAGASIISRNALNAFMMGIGYSKLYIPASLYDIYMLRYPEIILDTFKDNDGFISYDEKSLDKVINSSDSISIGMGMGVSFDLYKSIEYLLKNYTKTLIIDADALNSIAKYGVDILKTKKCNLIITPHIKEFSRLSGYETLDILKNMTTYAKEFANKYDLCIILKSSSSVISYKDNISINISGTTALAKGGSGDMLSGILTGVCAYLDEDIYKLASLSSFILGKCAELSNIPEEATTPKDITENIEKVIKLLKCE